MFGKVLGSYFKNLRLTVIPMAFTYLGALLLLLFAWRAASALVSILLAGISAAVGTAVTEFSLNAQELGAAFRGIRGFSGFVDFITDGVGTFVEKLGVTAADALTTIAEAASNAITRFFLLFLTGLGLFTLLFIVGFVLCSIAVRVCGGARVTGKTIIVNTVFKVILLTVALYGLGYAASLSSGWGALAAVGVILLEVFLTLFGAFVAQYKLRETRHVFRLVNPKTMASFSVLTVLLCGLSFLLGYGLFLLVGDAVISWILIAPLVVYDLCFLDACAEIYIAKGRAKLEAAAAGTPVPPPEDETPLEAVIGQGVDKLAEEK